MMKESIKSNGPRFSARRMVKEYVARYYPPLLEAADTEYARTVIATKSQAAEWVPRGHRKAEGGIGKILLTREGGGRRPLELLYPLSSIHIEGRSGSYRPQPVFTQETWIGRTASPIAGIARCHLHNLAEALLRSAASETPI